MRRYRANYDVSVMICVNLVSINICSGDILPSFELVTPSSNGALFSARSLETHFSKDSDEETLCHLVLILIHQRIFMTKYILLYQTVSSHLLYTYNIYNDLQYDI